MKKEYEKLQKKYNLPKFEELDKEFQISSIEPKNFLLKEIAKKVNDKFEFFAQLFEEVLNPESLISLHESNAFTELEKKEALRIFRKLQHSIRKHLLIELEFDEHKAAQQIKDSYKVFGELKEPTKKLILRMIEYWNKDKQTKFELNYFG